MVVLQERELEMERGEVRGVRGKVSRQMGKIVRRGAGGRAPRGEPLPRGGGGGGGGGRGVRRMIAARRRRGRRVRVRVRVRVRGGGMVVGGGGLGDRIQMQDPKGGRAGHKPALVVGGGVGWGIDRVERVMAGGGIWG